MMTNDHVEYLRTMVKGETDENDRIEQKLDESGWEGWQVFLAYCFYFAVDRRFKRPVDTAEIVRFVADTRAWVGDDGPEIDPTLAERLIRSVLDESVQIDVRKLDQEMLGRIETLVVYRVLSTSNMSDSELDDFLERARQKAIGNS